MIVVIWKCPAFESSLLLPAFPQFVRLSERMQFRRAILFLLVTLACPGAFAHDSPEHEIEALTQRMALSGRTADLLARRATEWRALGKLENAAADLRAALTLSTNSTALWCELASVLMLRGAHSEALQAANHAITLAPAATEQAPLRMFRAEVHENAGQYEAGLADCSFAFAHDAPMPDWYLTRARLQTRCGLFAESVRGLKEGFDKTGSVVLEIEWIEAMIDAGQTAAALGRIEPHLKRARWQGSWLVRRARAQIAGEEAKNDLRNALAEFERRIKPDRPEATLIAERGLAHALLGERTAASKDLALSRRLEAPASALLRLERALAGSSASAIR